MKAFLIRYFLTAALGAAIVHYGLPILHGSMSAGTVLHPVSPVAPVQRPPPVRIRSLPVASSGPSAPSRTDPAVDPPASSSPIHAESPPPAAQTAPRAERQNDRTAPGFWGVTVENARAYNREGRHVRDLAAGMLVEYQSTASSSVGDVAVCRVLFENRWVENVFIPLAALLRFEGSLEDVHAETRDLLVRYYSLHGKLAERQETLHKQMLESNPHASAYRHALREFQEYQRRVESRVAARDAATGGERSRIADELARMRGEGVRLQTALREADQQYRQWREANRERFSTDDDPHVRQIRQAIQDLEPKLREWVDLS